MGNSGSVHHMQSSLKELHSYYQGQGNAGEGLDDLPYLTEEQPRSLYGLEREKSLPRSKFSRIPTSSRTFNLNHHHDSEGGAAKSAQIKVLPKLKENLRLRSTTNGAILQSGGTISGRKDSLLPQPMPVLERSKTFIAEHSSESLNESNAARVMTRRSQTQLNIDLGKRSTQSGVSRNQLPHNSGPSKRYDSNRDLSATTDFDMEPYASICNSSESYQKLSKVKIKNKKRKAPPVPPLPAAGTRILQEMSTMERQTAELVHKEIERKQRLFKTKSETVLQGAYTRPPSVQPKIKPVSKPRLQPAPEAVRSSYRSKVEPISNPGFRREKSFDATLLSSRNKEAIHAEPKTSSTIKRKSLQPSTPIAPLLSMHKTDFKTERSDFKMELAAATKSRLLTKSTYPPEYKLRPREPSTRQREPNNDRPKPVKQQAPARTLSRPETQSKIPQLKKTFYFGMESAKLKSVDSSQQTTANGHEPKPTSSKDDILSTSTSSCKDNDPVYSLNEKSNSEINDNGIQVSVRPTLPRRQLEIPRFSPVAAWRTLTDEHRKQMLEPSGSSPRSSNLALEPASTFLVEDRIYRTYREPCPFYPDNKSGDSGISGDDAYLPEKPIQPRNLTEHDELMAIANLDGYPVDDQPMKVVGPFLTPWTPQQDLDEEDTSSDGDVAVKLIDSPSSTSAAHVFSLSLPRENQLSVYGEKSKPDFRSLQKLKRSVSGELTNGSACEYPQSSDSNIFGNVCLGNYLSDNWVLSKTGMPPNTEPSVACRNQTDSSKKTSYMDLSASIQPISLGCLATGKHVMYLPNRPIKELKRQSLVIPPMEREVLDDDLSKNTRMHSKRFSFQSSVRQIERRRLAERLSKDAEKKEALRKSELEAMIRVEEEFQRKRAHEKASIRHQLRLYSMDDDNFTSLPPEYSQNCNGLRAEPDGAVSSTSVSPILRTNGHNEEPGPYLAARMRNVDNEYRLNNELGMIFANS